MAKKTDDKTAKKAPAKKAAATKAPASKAKKTATKAAPKAKAGAKAAPKAPKAPKGEPVKTSARHPLGRVKALHGSKADLLKKVAEPLAVGDQDPDALAEKLRGASNKQLLRLLQVAETVKAKYGSRDKLIESLSSALGKAKDNDYVAKLKTFSLPRLLDMARGAERRAN
jgi:hypothetical protein